MLKDLIPSEALLMFKRLIGKDIGVACDFLMRHYRMSTGLGELA